MIVVATTDFELYHNVVKELRHRDANFTTIDPAEPLPDATSVVLTAASDTIDTDPEIRHITADPSDPRPAVNRALTGDSARSPRRVIGVDPGSRPGIAVVEDNTVIAAFQVPLDQAVSIIQDEVSTDGEYVVRIGDGARLHGARLVESLKDVRVELVDETGSTPHLGSGARGMGDVIAAINIASRSGEMIESREIQPTSGELQSIKSDARRHSAENRAITESLARQVAKGELTIEEALEEHRDRET